MEDLLGIIVFFGLAVVVFIMLFKLSNNKTRTSAARPYFMWVIISILSIIQTGCFGIFAGLNTIGNGGTPNFGIAILFFIIVFAWLLVDILSYNKNDN